jgi:hypothetical protein
MTCVTRELRCREGLHIIFTYRQDPTRRKSWIQFKATALESFPDLSHMRLKRTPTEAKALYS